MKLSEIKNLEETMRNNYLPQKELDATLDYVFANGEHTGDQDGKKVYVAQYQDTSIYGIMNDGQMTSFVTVSDEKDAMGYQKLLVMYTKDGYRSKRDIHRLLWFIKDHDQIKLISSGVQSDDANKLMRTLSSTGRFDMNWLNVETGEKEKYDASSDVYPSKYRSASITPWRIVIESASTPVFESRYTHMTKKVWHIFPCEDISYI